MDKNILKTFRDWLDGWLDMHEFLIKFYISKTCFDNIINIFIIIVIITVITFYIAQIIIVV